MGEVLFFMDLNSTSAHAKPSKSFELLEGSPRIWPSFSSGLLRAT